ncbi:sensor histidine kinase [Ramlibacter cellulosilyticus]|nr:HAMP domain-containing sensor histidine kinase [Ramlibacter cellulosilyticus]
MRHSLKARLVALFLLLAFALGGAFMFGMQKALGIGWRDAARPLVSDYVDRLAADLGSPPSVDRARALTGRLPITVRIEGPQVQWESHPTTTEDGRAHDRWARDDGLLVRTSADGHRIAFGLNVQPWRERPRIWAWSTLATLLLLTWVAYKFVRRLLRPLDDIRAGAQRFGRGEFTQAIPVRRNDELGELAEDVNTMARSIHQMLEAKRALLLAISHELRSPLTRARLHVELLPEGGEASVRREALLRELQEMADLVTELLESERLGQGHAALQREPADLGELVREVANDGVTLEIAPDVPRLELDRARVRLLVRNLVDNALRHGAAAQAPTVRVAREADGSVVLGVRDFGPGVDEGVLSQLAEPFYRPDASRERGTGGVGLGLYLSRLVAQAHGAAFTVRNAHPGLEVLVRFPAP